MRFQIAALAVLGLVVGAGQARSQPRAPQVDPSALAAAAARLGTLIWTPRAHLDRIGADPFVLRLPDTACTLGAEGCQPVYRSDFVLGGEAGADFWITAHRDFVVQTSARAVTDWYRRFSDQSSVAPDVSQALRYVAPRFHVDFGWRHASGRRGMLSEVAQRIRRTSLDRRLTAAFRFGRFAVETEVGAQRVRYRRPSVAHPSLRYSWFDHDAARWRAELRPAVAGPSRWAFQVERLAQRSLHRPVRERRVSATTVFLETGLQTGLRMEGRIGVGWTHQVRPDYHVQLGALSARTSAPVWRAALLLPGAAGDAEVRFERRFSQSVLPGPPGLDEFRFASRAGRRLTQRLRADFVLEHGSLVYQDRLARSTGRTFRRRCGTLRPGSISTSGGVMRAGVAVSGDTQN